MKLELPYLLQPYNICHFEGTSFFIGNRKDFPRKKEFVECFNCQQVGDALKQMVTQGGAPLQVALTAFKYVATQMDRKLLTFDFTTLEAQMLYIVRARETNTTMKRVVYDILSKISARFDDISFTTSDLVVEISDLVQKKEQEFDEIYLKMGKLGSSLINDNDTILTTCFAEHTFLLSLYFAKQQGKNINVLVNETRPYFQGTRLTAPSLNELKIDTKIISDAMGSFFMQKGIVTQYMSAADLVCMDGTVVNKIGTNQNAICANYYNIPYTAFSISPDKSKLSFKDIAMEYRDGKELLTIDGKYIGDENIGALYPAFDIIRGELVTNIVTNKGIFKPSQIRGVFL